MNKILVLGMLFVLSVVVFPNISFGQFANTGSGGGVTGTGKYQPLVTLDGGADIPGVSELNTVGDDGDLDGLFNGLFKLGVSIAIILAVVMVIWGGIEYMTSESPFGKGSGKERIGAAVGGLVLALSTIVIFNTIDPDIATTSINVKSINSEVFGEINQNPDITDYAAMTEAQKISYLRNRYGISGEVTLENGQTVSSASIYNAEGMNTVLRQNFNGNIAQKMSATLAYMMQSGVSTASIAPEIPTNNGRLACAIVVSSAIVKATGDRSFFTAETAELHRKLIADSGPGGRGTFIRHNGPIPTTAPLGVPGVLIVSREGGRAGHVVYYPGVGDKVFENSSGSSRVTLNRSWSSAVEDLAGRGDRNLRFYPINPAGL